MSGLSRNTPMPPRTAPLQARTPLERSAGLPGSWGPQRRVPLRQVSERRRAENRQRRKMIGELYPERPLCCVYELSQVQPGLVPEKVLARCGRWADDVHEPLSRARRGSIVDPGNMTSPCRPCHSALTFTPESELGWAYAADLLRHSWDRPEGGAA